MWELKQDVPVPSSHQVKVTVRPRFFGTVPIFNDVSRKKSVLPGCLYVSFLAWCPGFIPICPYLQPYLCVDGQKLAQILSVFMNKSLAAEVMHRTPLGELTMLPRSPSQIPDGSRLWRESLKLYDSRL